MSFNFQILKGAVNIVGAYGVHKLLKDFVKTNTIILNRRQKVTVWVGAMILESMIMEKTSEYVNVRVDTMIAKWQNWKAKKS